MLGTMGFIGWLILGLIAGAIAKLILPGKQGGGFWVTLLLGVVGAILGGLIARFVFNFPMDQFWSWQTWLFAIGGSIIVLLVWGLITRGRRKTA